MAIEHLLASHIHRARYIQTGDPGAVGAGVEWLDTNTSPPIAKKRNTGNTDWDVIETAPSGAAGGVLAGTYPNPSFASDMATQAELDAAVAALKDGVDTAYDTLAELAATLTDHNARHESGGSDAIKLDDLAAPDDTTDLNVSTSAHGLTPKLSNVATEYLSGTGVYSVPAGTGIPATIVDAKGDLIVATAADTVARLPVGSNGQLAIADSAQSTGLKYVDGHFAVGAELIATTGVGSVAIRTVPIVGTITQSDIDADVSGDAVVDVQKAAAGTPTSFASIVASAKPTLSSAQSATDATLTGWTLTVAAGDRLKFICESLTTATLVTNSLKIRRT